ncbi:beta-1,3-galactosyltransferase 2-like [Carassius carassius]|uniref:beta-1,3-galactosyltransferase 2-like n=1 Tax=Carassius carassius TaxID=217509 RepID=UPI002868F596|nr:beta-1,3-galactosyltransferase 2-like [Carassius carassius]
MVIMDWLATRFPQASYAMKIDSDMYINMKNLMSLLLAPNTPRENYITGYLMWNQNVIRNKKSKYYVSEDHVTKQVTKKWLEDHNIEVLDPWSGNSSDPSPIENLWCCLAQDRDLKCHIQTGFVLLVALTLSLSIIFFVYDFSFNPVKDHHTWFNLVNKIHKSYNVVTEGLSGKRFVWNFTTNQQIIQTITAQKHHISVHYHVAHPSNYHFILDEPDKCSQWDPFLVFMVPVAPHQVEARNAIRSTWGNESSVQGKAVLTLFLVGLTGGPEAQQKLEEESRQHRDLVQSNFVDSYFNLTIKTMVIMDWLATCCPRAAYAMKVDSDMYINMKNLMSLLLAPNTPRQNYITGYLMWNQNVIRNKKSKYYVSEELYPASKYPTYVLGVAYVFSNDLPKKVVEASKDMKPFNIEDAYVGTCLKRLGIKPSRAPDPSQFQTYMKDSKGHDLSKVITTIARSPKQIIEFWQKVKRHK